MTDKKDWRLNNQEKYLKGVTLVRRSYRQYAKNPKWDHDHCDFCWEKFSLTECEGSIREGYATVDDYHWICPACFEDFKDMFEWKVIDSQKSGNGA
jgi:hypothetical protein